MASLLVVALAGMVSLVSADSASIYPISAMPYWAQASTMSLEFGAPALNLISIPFEILPLTANVGLNQTEGARNNIFIGGEMIPVDTSNYVDVTSNNTMAYLSCDMVNNSNIEPDMMINTLMNNDLMAILLYSSQEDSCWLDGSQLPYTSIFTMTDKTQAVQALNLMTNSTPGSLNATIFGNNTNSDDDFDGGDNNSAVAMSILYSITGLITLLFLIIIATGAIRAHRYPERYGPRSASGGRPRQSRARGLARAVLETLPIVKFGDPMPSKPDPAVELETQSTTASHEVTMGAPFAPVHEDVASPERNAQSEDRAESGAEGARQSPVVTAQAEEADGSESHDHEQQQQQEEDHPGCSICTEDFTVGEDVRVLPCNHKFHPQCIDPWLIDVSGTCPLCRLDLRPQSQQDQTAAATAEDQLQLPPPLEVDMNEQQETGAADAGTRTRRASRLPDLHRLRHASVEERIEILRRHRSQHGHASAAARVVDGGDTEDRGRRARLTDRLRERFRIRTRAQAPTQGSAQASAPSPTPNATQAEENSPSI